MSSETAGAAVAEGRSALKSPSPAPRRRFGRSWGTLVFLIGVLPLRVFAADVTGYSLTKGHFLYQTGPTTLELDPDFGFSLLANVDLVPDEGKLRSARLRLPEGDTLEMDDYSDYWSILDSYETGADLDEAYTWGDYVMLFDGVEDGKFSCLLEMPETPLPPVPRLVNFGDVQAVDASRPLVLTWEFDAPPRGSDFMQVYVTLGHGEVFSTPGPGEPGALTVNDRSVTIPAGTFEPGYVHSLNLELDRIVSTNSACHPTATGVASLFRSTTVDVWVYVPPTLRWLPGSTNRAPAIEVVTEPELPVVLQVTGDLRQWSDLATNSAASGTNVFAVPPANGVGQLFRAVIR